MKTFKPKEGIFCRSATVMENKTIDKKKVETPRAVVEICKFIPNPDYKEDKTDYKDKEKNANKANPRDKLIPGVLLTIDSEIFAEIFE